MSLLFKTFWCRYKMG